MEELKWSKLMEVFGRDEAELIESYLEAHGIEAELFQEGYEHLAYPVFQSRVEIFVPSLHFDEAQKLCAESGWEFEILDEDEETDPDEESDSPAE